MLWLLAFHIIFVVSWFAGLFYLPRLFVYHASASDAIGIERFKVMEHKLFWYIMTPAGVLASALGVGVLLFNWQTYLQMGWMHAKLGLVLLLWLYHGYCGFLLHQFKFDKNTKSERFYRFFNEVPTFLLIGIVVLVVVQPQF